MEKIAQRYFISSSDKNPYSPNASLEDKNKIYSEKDVWTIRRIDESSPVQFLFSYNSCMRSCIVPHKMNIMIVMEGYLILT